MGIRMTKIPNELFSASIRDNDTFYRGVAKYVSLGELMSLYYFGA